MQPGERGDLSDRRARAGHRHFGWAKRGEPAVSVILGLDRPGACVFYPISRAGHGILPARRWRWHSSSGAGGALAAVGGRVGVAGRAAVARAVAVVKAEAAQVAAAPEV